MHACGARNIEECSQNRANLDMHTCGVRNSAQYSVARNRANSWCASHSLLGVDQVTACAKHLTNLIFNLINLSHEVILVHEMTVFQQADKASYGIGLMIDLMKIMCP